MSRAQVIRTFLRAVLPSTEFWTHPRTWRPFVQKRCSMSMRPWWISIRHGLLSGNGGCTHYDFCHCIGSLWDKEFGNHIRTWHFASALCFFARYTFRICPIFTFWIPSRSCSMKHFHISLLKSSDKSCQFLPFDMASPLVSPFIFFNFQCVHVLWFRFFRSPLLDTDRFRRGFWGTNRRVRERHGAIRQQSCSKKKMQQFPHQIFTTLKLIIRLGANFFAEILPDLRSSSRPPVLKYTWALRNWLVKLGARSPSVASRFGFVSNQTSNDQL